MLRLVIVILNLVLTVTTVDILGVSYTFDEDFHRTFDKKNCALRSEWMLVNYDSLDVAAPYNSSKAIRAASHSCATSFPIVLIPGSSLEFNVFVRTNRKKSGVFIFVYDEHDDPVTKCVYNKYSKGFVPGWRRVTLQIEKNGMGYINLMGYSGDNEIVLVDSFNYMPNISKTEESHDDAQMFIAHKEDARNTSTDLIVNDYSVSENEDELKNYDKRSEYADNNFENYNEGSGDAILDPVVPLDGNESLGPWAIALIAVCAVTGLGVLGVGVYHLGLIKGLAVNPPFFDVEPARAVRIPRVRGVRESPIERIGRTWDD